MSNKKENLKKSLGITEYPWSSDDDDTNMNPHILHSQPIEPRHSVADTPGTSGSAQASAIPPTSPKRNHARVDRDVFWSMLNNPHRALPASTNSSRTPRPHVLHELLDSTIELQRSNAAAEMQNIYHTYNRFSRNMNNFRPRFKTNSYPVPRAPGPSRNPIFTPSRPTPEQILANFRIRKAVKKIALNKAAASNVSQNSLSGLSDVQPTTSRWSNVTNHLANNTVDNLDAPAERNAVNIDPTSKDPLVPQTSRIENNLELAEATSDPPVNMSLEEEIVEIDPEANIDNVDNPGASDTPPADNNETVEVVATTSGTSPSAKQSHGVKRKREGSDESSEPCTVQELNQSLLRLLECPVCLEWMEPPMSQCRRGHLVCSRCRVRLASCPVCRTIFSSVRNRAMEGVAEMLRYPCRHGCGREVRLRRRAPHEASCAARRYHCPALACADHPPLPRADLAAHFQSQHMPMVKVGRKHKFSMKLNSEQHDNWLIMALHELFHLRVDIDIQTWGVIVYVVYIGPKCNANGFTYEVVMAGQYNARKIVYTRATHSDLERSTLNVNRQDCFHLTLDQALNFLRFNNRYCESDKFIEFTVEISKHDTLENVENSDS